MVQFNINMDELPLGQLSKRHITEGFAVLSDIAELLAQPADAKRDALLRDQSSRFATVIPQVAPETIGTPEQLNGKVAMLEALRDMELAAKLVGTPGSSVGAQTPTQGLHPPARILSPTLTPPSTAVAIETDVRARGQCVRVLASAAKSTLHQKFRSLSCGIQPIERDGGEFSLLARQPSLSPPLPFFDFFSSAVSGPPCAVG